MNNVVNGFLHFIGAFNCPPVATRRPPEKTSRFAAIADRFTSLAQVQQALRAAGLEVSQMIVGIDFTKSNTYNGKHSFGDRSLHDTVCNSNGILNPYQRALDIIGRTLEPFDEDHEIPVFGFGDSVTTDRAVFPLKADGSPCFGLVEIHGRYNEIASQIVLSGPTSFVPLIRRAIEIVTSTRQYHILVILTDGEVSDPDATGRAIVEASFYPLSIIAIGVGDADFSTMHEYDDELPDRRFDNFQFVEFKRVVNERTENPDVAFAVAALQEIPDQYQAIKALKLL